MILAKRILFAVLLIVSPGSTGFAGGFEDLITNAVFDNEVGVDVPLNFVEELTDNRWVKPGVGAGFQFMNHPTEKDSYLRKETFQFSIATPSIGLLGSAILNLPTLKVSSEMVRPFEKRSIPGAAQTLFNEPPYLPHQLPHSAENATGIMQKGEYYAFSAHLSLGLSADKLLSSGIQYGYPSLYARYIVQGDFKIELYKISENKVKAIISNIKSKAKAAGVKLDFIPDLEVLGIEAVDQLISSALEARVLDWQFLDKEKSSLFSISYIYDLTTNEGVEAFNALMNPKNWKLPKISLKKNGATQTLNHSVVDLAQSKGYAGQSVAGVEHVDQSKLNIDYESRGVRVDILVADKERKRRYTEIDYEYVPTAHADPEFYRIANLNMTRIFDVPLIGEANISRTATAVFDLTSDYLVNGFREIFFSYHRSDDKLRQNLTKNEFKTILGHFRRMLPVKYRRADKTFEGTLKPGINQKTHVALDFYFNPLALQYVAQMSFSEVSDAVDSIMDEIIPVITRSRSRSDYGYLEITGAMRNTGNSGGKSQADYFDHRKMSTIKQKLFLAFKQGQSPVDFQIQWESFAELRNNKIFRDLGLPMLIRILEVAIKKYHVNGKKHGIDSLVAISAQVQINGQSKAPIKLGDYERSVFTQEIIAKKDRVLNRSYNPAHF